MWFLGFLLIKSINQTEIYQTKLWFALGNNKLKDSGSCSERPVC